MAERIGLSGRSSYSAPAAAGCATGRSAGAAATAAAAGAVDAAATSRRTMRPPGPLPWMSLRSTPDCAAIFLASGEAFTRPPSPLGCGTDAAATASCTRRLPGDSEPVLGDGLRAAGSSLFGCGGTAAGRSAMPGLAPLGAAAGAPEPACATTAPMSSFSSAMTPINEPTGALLPAATRILRSTPEPNASISTSALSVSTSARMSPDWMRSPSFLSHLMILPVSICSESLGMTTLVTAMAQSAPVAVRTMCIGHAADGLDDAVLGRRLELLEVARVGHRRRHAGDALNGRVEVVEGLLGDDGRELGAHAGEAGARLHHHRAVGLADRAQD